MKFPARHPVNGFDKGDDPAVPPCLCGSATVASAPPFRRDDPRHTAVAQSCNYMSSVRPYLQLIMQVATELNSKTARS